MPRARRDSGIWRLEQERREEKYLGREEGYRFPAHFSLLLSQNVMIYRIYELTVISANSGAYFLPTIFYAFFSTTI